MTNPVQQAVPVAQEYPATAIGALTGYQRQIDSDGTFVGVSRQALDELIAWAETRRLPLPCKSGEGAGESEAEKWRHKLWMVACHATGGGIPEIEGVDRSVNDICVQITQSRNMIYQAGKDAALRSDATQTREAELVAALEQIDRINGGADWNGTRTIARAALNARDAA